MASGIGKWAVLLLLCGNAYAACPGGATSLDSATTTDAAIHTALSSGSVCLTGSSTVTVDQTVTIPSTNVLYSDSGATLSVTTGGQVAFSGSGRLEGLTITTTNVANTLKVEGAGIAPTITGNTFTGAAGGFGLYPYVVQNSNPPSPTITNNTYNNAQIYCETCDNATWSGNTFTNTAGKRPIQCLYCDTVTVEDNTISGCIVGIIFINYHSISGTRKAIANNIIQDNTVSGCTEETISLESNGQELSVGGIRDYDTVGSTAGTNQVVLADADWTADTTYNTGNYYLGFATGTRRGEYYKISAQSGATFTLTGMTAGLLAGVTAGDEVWIGLPFLNNQILRNTVNVTEANAYGIVLYGIVYDTTVGGSPANRNTITTTLSNQTAMTCTSLDNLYTGAVAGNAVDGPCDNNDMSFNLITGPGSIKPNKFINCAGGCAEDTTPNYTIDGNDATRSNAGSGLTPGTIRKPIKRLRMK